MCYQKCRAPYRASGWPDSVHAWAVRRHQSIPNAYRTYHHRSGTVFDELTMDAANTRIMLIPTGHIVSVNQRRHLSERDTTVHHERSHRP
jgi:hypothetical protein